MINWLVLSMSLLNTQYMNRQQFQRELLEYTHSLLVQSQYSDAERSVQLSYQMGILLSLLTDLADCDSYNYKRILYRVHPELRPPAKRG